MELAIITAVIIGIAGDLLAAINIFVTNESAKINGWAALTTVMLCCRAARAVRGRMARMARLGAGRPERGSSVVELAVLAPALMMICMLILQFGLWFNARQAALAAAQAGALVAREQAATNPGWAGAAQNAAAQLLRQPAHAACSSKLSAARLWRHRGPMCTSRSAARSAIRCSRSSA